MSNQTHCEKCGHDVFRIGHTPSCPVPLEQEIRKLRADIFHKREQLEISRACARIVVKALSADPPDGYIALRAALAWLDRAKD